MIYQNSLQKGGNWIGSIFGMLGALILMLLSVWLILQSTVGCRAFRGGAFI
jgi:hypothetical protein